MCLQVHAIGASVYTLAVFLMFLARFWTFKTSIHTQGVGGCFSITPGDGLAVGEGVCKTYRRKAIQVLPRATTRPAARLRAGARGAGAGGAREARQVARTCLSASKP